MSMLSPAFIPMSIAEMSKLGWDGLDILLITGDAYVDHPSYGIALIGRILLATGYKVGIVAQPDWSSTADLLRLGRPRLACLVSSGNMDSMVNIYTAARRKRNSDVYSVNGETGKRPPHALTVYCQLAKQAFKGLPIIIGGLEASLRRVAHYDYWQDKLRQSVIVGCKADIAVYGQGEKPILDIMKRLEIGEALAGIPGTFRLLGKAATMKFTPDKHYLRLSSWNEMQADKDCLMTSTKLVEQQMNSWGGTGLYQAYGEQLVVIEAPPEPLTTEELDRVHELPFSGCPHPIYKGHIPAFETIKHSIPAVRGCPGGCAFCGLVSHQGRMVSSRSQESIIKDVMRMKSRSNFRGTISDIGGAAGNIYGSRTLDVEQCRQCHRASCLFPKQCPNFICDGKQLIQLLRQVRAIPGVKHLHINSGIRLDLAVQQKALSRELIHHHVSGHMKVAPEHLHPTVTKMMRKNPAEDFYTFMKLFEAESRAAGKEQYLIPLFISNFPGCTEREMQTVDDFLNRHNWSPQQVQDYIPLPMTMGAAMYYTGKDATGNSIQVNRGLKARRPQLNSLKRRRRGDKRQSGYPKKRKH